jgi:hypothetical protein
MWGETEDFEIPDTRLQITPSWTARLQTRPRKEPRFAIAISQANDHGFCSNYLIPDTPSPFGYDGQFDASL